MYDYLTTPSIVVELETAEKNIKAMVEMNRKYNITHRPHIKAHKSIYLAKKQIEAGAKGITCAKLGEAEVMAEAGFDDILLAYTLIGKDKLERYNNLHKVIKISTVVNSIKGAKEMSDYAISQNQVYNVLIEVDGGINRGGLKPLHPTLDYAKAIKDFSGIKILGFMYYGGDIYGEVDEEGVKERSIKEANDLIETKKLLENEGITIGILSAGSSFSAKYPECLNGITEVRAGNYIFNDGAQLGLDFIKEEDCALRIVSTVVAKPDDFNVIIDAGSKTLTSDLCKGKEGYGFVVGRNDIILYKLNEEHGFLSCKNPIHLEIGDKIAIIPNHACVVPNLADEMYGIRNGKVEYMIDVSARGKNN